MGTVSVRDVGEGTGEVRYEIDPDQQGRGYATRSVRLLLEHAFTRLGVTRAQAHVPSGHVEATRVATRSGLMREGVVRVAAPTPDQAGTAASQYLLFGRLATDPPVSEPQGFRALLNSFLPRKRAIAQMLIRDEQGRVLLCRLTYKRDWDLPGGVVEVSESPRLAVSREVAEELALDVTARRLLLVDWLPPWGGWDDAVCLVFDGGVLASGVVDDVTLQAREIRGVAFCDPEQVRERCADFTARRVESALAAVQDPSVNYSESGTVSF